MRTKPQNDKVDSWVPSSGQIIAGRYRIERGIGAGGMGAVVSAVHIALGERVALKFLNPASAVTKDAIGRFFREARATSRIKSEHVVRVTDVGMTAHGIPFIAMELLEGEDLASLISRGSVPLELAVDCVLQAAEALSEAHAAGVVHRDIKPSNLWMAHRRNGSPLFKVLDFGISKLIDVDEANGGLTATHAVFGSPTYMSPEQIRSAKRVDHRTDVWALGVVLHELLTASTPFQGESITAVLAAICADPPAALSSLRPDLPAQIEHAVLRCLEKDPTRRASLAELAWRLAPYASSNGKVSADRISKVGTGRTSFPPLSPSGGSVSPVVGMPETASVVLSHAHESPPGGSVSPVVGMPETASVVLSHAHPPRQEGQKRSRRFAWVWAGAGVGLLTLVGLVAVKGRLHPLQSAAASTVAVAPNTPDGSTASTELVASVVQLPSTAQASSTVASPVLNHRA